MTTEDFALIAIGMILNAGVFACGILVGFSLTRKDVRNDSDSYEEKVKQWHGIHRAGGRTEGGA